MKILINLIVVTGCMALMIIFIVFVLLTMLDIANRLSPNIGEKIDEWLRKLTRKD